MTAETQNAATAYLTALVARNGLSNDIDALRAQLNTATNNLNTLADTLRSTMNLAGGPVSILVGSTGLKVRPGVNGAAAIQIFANVDSSVA